MTPTEELAELVRQTGVELVRHPRSAAIDVHRKGAYLVTCRNVRDTIKFVAQLYPVDSVLTGPRIPPRA